MGVALVAFAVVIFLVVLFAIAAIKVAREYERGIVFRLGRLFPEPKGPGIWPTDATQIDIEELKDVVFRNPIIHEFLEGHGKYFLSTNKGLGKTLLLTCKRSILTHAAGRSQLFFNPEGRPYLDFMTDIPKQSNNHEAFLSVLANAKRLWALSLRDQVGSGS